MVSKKLLYHCSVSSQTPQEFLWNFLIINEPREIKTIRGKIFDQLRPLEELKSIDSCLIPNSQGIHYDLFSIYSSVPESKVDFSQIYIGFVRRDRNLQPKKSPSGWNGLIDLAFNGKI